MAIHATAVVDAQAQLDDSVTIAPHVVIEGDVRIAADCRLDAGAVVYGPTRIGPGTRIHAHAVIGDLPQDRAFTGEHSIVEIGAGCIVREGVTIHRGSQRDSQTIVGDRCFLMTNSHIGHNCVLESDVTLISGALLGGHVHVGRGAVISGNSAVHQFVRIGELAMVSGMAKIVQDIPPFFMTDRDGALVGVNRVGLIRARFSSAERDELKAAFRIFYRSGLNRTETFQQLFETVKTDAGKRLLTFLSGETKRGISGPASRPIRSLASEQPSPVV